MPHMYEHDKPTSGFTLVEVLVVAPIMVIVIGVLVGLLVTLAGNVMVSNGKSLMAYETRDALTQIEQDAFLSTAFLDTFTPGSPQDINDAGSTAFTSDTGTATSIIFNEYSTTKSPLDSSREIVYYANQPQLCTQEYRMNKPLYAKVVYFIKNNTLYRRVIVPANNQNVTVDADTTCAAPWQRNTCTEGVTATPCQTKDTKVLAGVSSMDLLYYKKSSPSTPVSPITADGLRVTLNVTRTLGGKPTTYSLSIAALRINGISQD